MTDWSDLDREADRWALLGRRLEFWWRDDDAIADSSPLRRLIDRSVPIAIAVIPEGLEESLVACLDAAQTVKVLQHGVSHRNRAGAGDKKSEFPASRPIEEALQELAGARKSLESAFGRRFVPVLTPPWNRVAPNLAQRLPEAGISGLSTYRARKSAWAAPGVLQVNTHVDVIDWRGTRGFIGWKNALSLVIGHLEAKRAGGADPNEPTGLLTHHLVHDTETWRFLEDFCAWAAARPAVAWRPANEIFPMAASL